jgi:hypothetical protein
MLIYINQIQNNVLLKSKLSDLLTHFEVKKPKRKTNYHIPRSYKKVFEIMFNIYTKYKNYLILHKILILIDLYL